MGMFVPGRIACRSRLPIGGNVPNVLPETPLSKGMIHWVFFDVGNILLDEDPLAYANARIHWEEIQRVHPAVSFPDLMAERERRAVEGSRWPLFEAVSAWLDEAACAAAWERAEREIRPRFAELSPLIAGAPELVEQLAKRYRLGLIANQGAECRRRLENLRLLHYFEVVAFSEEQGIAKPDPALFANALAEAGVSPEHSVMIGDRLDNDIGPASALGMRTLWIRWPRRASKGWNPDDPDAIAWRDSLERLSELANRVEMHVRPSLMVDEVSGVAGALIASSPCETRDESASAHL
jgi:HAD superfamily hydrolase (TIGR01549 family)